MENLKSVGATQISPMFWSAGVWLFRVQGDQVVEVFENATPQMEKITSAFRAQVTTNQIDRGRIVLGSSLESKWFFSVRSQSNELVICEAGSSEVLRKSELTSSEREALVQAFPQNQIESNLTDLGFQKIENTLVWRAPEGKFDSAVAVQGGEGMRFFTHSSSLSAAIVEQGMQVVAATKGGVVKAGQPASLDVRTPDTQVVYRHETKLEEGGFLVTVMDKNIEMSQFADALLPQHMENSISIEERVWEDWESKLRSERALDKNESFREMLDRNKGLQESVFRRTGIKAFEAAQFLSDVIHIAKELNPTGHAEFTYLGRRYEVSGGASSSPRPWFANSEISHKERVYTISQGGTVISLKPSAIPLLANFGVWMSRNDWGIEPHNFHLMFGREQLAIRRAAVHGCPAVPRSLRSYRIN